MCVTVIYFLLVKLIIFYLSFYTYIHTDAVISATGIVRGKWQAIKSRWKAKKEFESKLAKKIEDDQKSLCFCIWQKQK